MLNSCWRHDVLVCSKTSESHEEFVDTLTELSKKYFNFLQNAWKNEFTKKNTVSRDCDAISCIILWFYI
jgi:hypothetical protein